MSEITASTVTSVFFSATTSSYAQPNVDDSIRKVLDFIAFNEREQFLLAYLKNRVCQLLKIESESFDVYRVFSDTGVDKEQLSKLRNTFEAHLGVSLPGASTLRGMSIAQLGKQILEKIEATSAQALTSLHPKEQLYPVKYPLSSIQYHLWSLTQFTPAPTTGNLVRAFRLSEQVSVEVLRQAIEAIVARHEILRATFAVVSGTPRQIVAEKSSVTLPIMELNEHTGSPSETVLKALFAQEIQRPFDLVNGPLLRTMLLRSGEHEYTLLLTLHRIISDDRSIELFSHELQVLCEALSRGLPLDTQSLSLQYGDFATWQRQQLPDQMLHEQLTYWKQQLVGVPLLQLPTDSPGLHLQTYQRAELEFVLPEHISEVLSILCRQEGVSISMILLTAFITLIHRYTGQDDLVISTIVSNRNHLGLEHLIGPLTNICIIRADLSDNPPFRSFLQRIRNAEINACVNQMGLFERLVEELFPGQQLERTPLTQIGFKMQRMLPDSLPLIESQMLSPVVDTASTFQWDVLLDFTDTQQGLKGIFVYNACLFDEPFILRMAGHYQTLLANIITHIDEHISHLLFLTKTECSQFLREWNSTQVDYPNNKCLHQLFEEQTLLRPDAIAVVWGDEAMTYRQLNRQANQLAHHLRRQGVRPDTPVGLYVERSLALVVGILGILKAAGAYVPLDPLYPRERVALMLQDAHVPYLVTQITQLTELFPVQAQVICLDLRGCISSQEGTENLRNEVTAENLAYIIYTSGSTGHPKGIALRHRGVVNNLVDLNHRFAVGPEDSILVLSSVSFDMCVYEILGLLSAGGKIVVPIAAKTQDPEHWANLLVKHCITIWNSAPSLLKLLIEYIIIYTHDLPRFLRLALLGGDWIPVNLPDKLRALVEGIQVISLGGATEASIHSIIYPITECDPTWKSIPYGKPMANQHAYILDKACQLVPIGVPGELYLGGVGLARGYFHHPELTAERFIPHPFCLEPGERLYRTGDLARYSPEGNIELLGRMDFQVKIRGLRIEFGEIEATLRKHAAIQDAIVLAKADETDNKQLVAYIVPKGEETPTNDDLYFFLRKTLAEYMLPHRFVILQSMPLSPNGKVDRRALATLEVGKSELKTSFVYPRTLLEEVVSIIWAEVLHLEQIGVYDNFFEIGGHSLFAIQIITRLQEAFQVDLSFRSFLEATTVAEQAELLKTAGSAMGQNVTKIAQTLLWLYQLSDDEIEAMLDRLMTQPLETEEEA